MERYRGLRRPRASGGDRDALSFQACVGGGRTAADVRDGAPGRLTRQLGYLAGSGTTVHRRTDGCQSSQRGQPRHLGGASFTPSVRIPDPPRREGTKERRTPEQVASLTLGFDTFLDFATDVGAITDTERSSYWERCWQALGEAAAIQATYQASEDPVTRFLELIGAALATQLAHAASVEGNAPTSKPGTWGWRVKATAYGEELTPGGSLIGWLDGDELLLEPDTAYSVAQKLARSQGDNIAMKQRTLWKRLDERGLLGATDPDRHTAKRTAGGERRRVVPLPIASLSLPESGQQGDNGDGNANPCAPIILGIGASAEKSGQRIVAPRDSAPIMGAKCPDPTTESGQQMAVGAPSQAAGAPIAPIIGDNNTFAN